MHFPSYLNDVTISKGLFTSSIRYESYVKVILLSHVFSYTWWSFKHLYGWQYKWQYNFFMKMNALRDVLFLKMGMSGSLRAEPSIANLNVIEGILFLI